MRSEKPPKYEPPPERDKGTTKFEGAARHLGQVQGVTQLNRGEPPKPYSPPPARPGGTGSEQRGGQRPPQTSHPGTPASTPPKK